MSNVIEFKEGAVCFAYGKQWFQNEKGSLLFDEFASKATHIDLLIKKEDFQLNTIKQGDYIEASELDNKKYNDVVEVFGLFGFEAYERCSKEALRPANEIFFASDSLLLLGASDCSDSAKRKLTYNQLMAIGELKRLEIEREKKEARECFVEVLDETVAHAEKLENEWTDKHYDFNYQLTQEDIDKGHIRIDAYFVNRMWKVNSWDDTGAGFHIVKTIPRIANSKNPLERELIALHKQINALCKLHGVDTSQI